MSTQTHKEDDLTRSRRPRAHGADSPRSHVARQITQLNINKRNRSQSSSPAPEAVIPGRVTGMPAEIAETPGCRRYASTSPVGSPTKRARTRDHGPNGKTAHESGTSLFDETDWINALSRPRDAFHDREPDDDNEQHQEDELDDDGDHPSNLTWQEFEITGHEIDLVDTADDGEGINGIGFRPTAAIAAQRAMKRRLQVRDYKAREASDQRSKRLDRRKEVEVDRAEDFKAARRSVRFAADR